MSIPMIITPDSLAFVYNTRTYTAQYDHPHYHEILAALRKGLYDEAVRLVNIASAIKSYCNGKIEVNEDYDTVSYMGRVVHGTIITRIVQMMREGFNINPLVNFLDNLMQNPSARAVNELYDFLEYGQMPITPDGHFLAYKRVREDYKSVHDGKTDNSIGAIVEMPRNQVNDNSHEVCSYGLHFCSHEYLKSFSGSKVVILKINPRDVVSIPVDYNHTKGRACRYEVVGELSPEEVSKALSESVWNTSVVDDYEDDGDDDDRYYDDAEYSDDVNFTDYSNLDYNLSYDVEDDDLILPSCHDGNLSH